MFPNQVNVFRIILPGKSQYYPTQQKYAEYCVLCAVELNLYIECTYIYIYIYIYKTGISVLRVLTCRGLRPMSNKRRRKIDDSLT